MKKIKPYLLFIPIIGIYFLFNMPIFDPFIKDEECKYSIDEEFFYYKVFSMIFQLICVCYLFIKGCEYIFF